MTRSAGWHWPVGAVVLWGVTLAAQSAFGQTSTPPPQPAQTGTGQTSVAKPAGQAKSDDDLPVNIDKIRELLGQRDTVNLNLGRPHLKFYAGVTAKSPTFTDLVGHYDLMRGAAPHAAALSGNEFMTMTTPKEMYSSAGITPTDMLQFALTNLAAQALVKKGLEEIRNAHDQAEVETIRARIDRELRALMSKNGGG